MAKIKGVEFSIAIDNIDKVIAEKNELVQRAMMECGFDMERFAKEELYPGHGKITGRLQNSITFATMDFHSNNDGDPATEKDSALRGTPEAATVYVGTNVEYAQYVELGSSRRRGGGYHYLKNAVQNHIDDYRRIIENVLSGK